MYKRTILITGASGFIGAYLAKYYISKNLRVVSIEHDKHPRCTSKIIGVHDDIIWCSGSIEDLDLILRILADYEVTDVIHTAALPIERGGYFTGIPYFKTNVLGTVNVMEGIKEQKNNGFNINCIHFSSDKAYGDLGFTPYVETMRVNPTSIYSCSKACSDLVALSYYFVFNLNVSVVRFCNIYGYGDTNPRIISNTITKCLENKNPIIFENLDTVREYIYIDDVCSATNQILTNMSIASGEIFNIGSGETFRQSEVVEKILAYFPHLTAIYQQALPYTKNEIKFQKLDSKKFQTRFSWLPETSFDDGIKLTIDTYKNSLKRI